MDSSGAGLPRASRRTVIWRVVAYGAVLLLVLGVAVINGSLPSPEEVRDWAEGLGDLAYVAFVPLFVMANFVIPWGILAGAAGLLFGTAAGTPLALAGVTGAALAQMFVSRRLAGGHHGSLLPERVRGLETFLTRHGTVAVMESRIVPLLPYGAVNFSAGLTTLRFREMALGTVVGGAPKVFAYTALGGSLTDVGSPEGVAALVLILALGLAGALLVRHRLATEAA
ncbi:MAG TPA: VTT domain-containing protein [Thermoleophilaceae bacterium]|jgi:uncharacterized membrane protein YdjX (TVP38/TMEM64 family)|nr:VTT domain-containing protein [Thermoleophilaceae bacterium]